MHELSLCQAILDHVDRRADGRPVRRVEVRIGHLRQVVPDSLQFAWEMLTDGTPYAASELVVEHIPGRVHCRGCGADTVLDWPVLACSACEGVDVELRSGDELELAWFDVVGAADVGEGGSLMGRFHRHTDGLGHVLEHDHDHGDHEHDEHDEHEHRDVGDHSGYPETGGTRVAVLESILSENDRIADANRARFAAAGVRAVNLMSSPGAGKTSLLKRTLAALGEEVRVGVLEGDIATSLDADELAGFGAAISLVNTSAGFGGECHLDAVMVRSGLGRLPLDQIDLLLIENVGNLVCPAEFDVGEHAKAMVYAVTEGEEKPLKYPVMFRAADVVVVNKVDLLPYLDVDLDVFLRNLHDVNPRTTVIQASARTGQGVDEWCRWLRDALV